MTPCWRQNWRVLEGSRRRIRETFSAEGKLTIVSPGKEGGGDVGSLEAFVEGGCSVEMLEGMRQRVELERPESAVVCR